MARMLGSLAILLALGLWGTAAEAWQLTCTTDRQAYSENQTRITATALTDDGGPIQGLTVAFSVTYPDGSVVSRRPDTTDASGEAHAQWKAKHFDPPGIFTATCSATFEFVPLSASAAFYSAGP